MKKTLRVVLSMLLVASAALTGSAQQLASKKGGELVDAKREALTQKATPAPDFKEIVPMAQAKSHTSFGTNALRSATNPTLLSYRKPVLHEGANVPEIFGSVIYSSNSAVGLGVYQVPSNSAQSFELVTSGPNAIYGGVLLDGIYYAHEYESFLGIINIYTINGYDMETGDVVYTYSINDNSQISAGLSEYNGTVYGIFQRSSGGGFQLGTIQYSATPVVTTIAELDGSWNGFAIDGNGQGYGMKTGSAGTELWKINLSDGTTSLVGSTGVVNQYVTDMAFETRSNRLFWTICPPDETGLLAEVNTTTGAATVLYEFPDGEEVCGLYIPTPPAEGAPSGVTNLAVDFPKGALSGTIKFNLPATTYDGNTATGTVNYSVTVNGVEVASGSGAYGSAVSVAHTVAYAGNYDVAVIASNAEGKGPAVKQSVYIGVGVPSTPEVSLVYEGGNMKISWVPVTSTVEGGYIDPKAVVYDVVRYPGAVPVVNGLNANAISQEIEETEILTMYYYTVVAHNGEKKSAAGKSNIVTLGQGFPTPWSCTFDSADDLASFTVVDANEDGRTWSYYSTGEVRVQYNGTLAMDDWLITAPLKFEANKLYEIEFDARAHSASYPERIEVMIGAGNSVADMTTVLLEPTDIKGTSKTHLKVRYVPQANGYLNIGFHGISDKNEYYLYVDNISVSGPGNADIPAAVSDLTIEPAPNGDLYANISFVTPSKLLSGKDITELTKIDVLMDGEVIFNARPLVGTKITCPAVVEQDGMYNFTVVAYNANGAGDPVSASEWIGIDYPEVPANIKLSATSNENEIKVTWDPVTKDVRGANINATYTVRDLQNNVVLATGLTEPTYTYEGLVNGEQDWISVGVFANSTRGEGEGDLVQGIMGKPYVDFFESFAGPSVSCLGIITDVANQGGWAICSDSQFSDLASYDLDNGFIVMQGKYLESTASLILGKISLANLTEPMFSFYTYNIADDDINIYQVYVDDLSDDADYQLVDENYVCETGVAGEWNKVLVDLSAYKGKEIVIKVTGIIEKYTNIMFDAFKVANPVEKDLAVSVDAPATIAPAKEFNVNVTVKNIADVAAGAYTVKVKANNVVVKTIEEEALAFNSAKTFTIPYSFSAVDEDPIEFSAVVVYDGDVNTANNTSDVVTVTPKVSIYPAPTDLEGEVVPEGVQLTWGEPDLTGNNTETKIEDFESGVAGDHEFAGWTFVDVDQSPIGGFQNMEIPGAELESLVSFFVFDATNFADTFAAHSGTKYLAAMFRYDDGQTDDWAISPALTGDAQTVSFYAKSYSADYPEKIEVYYSTGSLVPADFVQVEGVGGTVPGDWTLYTAALPAGAKYFAIRSCATSSWMLMLDDVTYETGMDFSKLSVVGYNVYRNGVKLNDEPVEEPEFLDATATAQNNEYAVTAVYAEGESKASEKLLISTTGLDQVVAGVEIVAEVGQIIVTGAEGLEVSVVAVDGKVVYAAAGQAKTVVNVAAGVYVVKAGDKVAKVLVK
ncbi:MAG: choice-of-anchor J domain-containing protein [Muribaculum sp.]|nr:choice-of-anchor J domain-containing protein [Muribaculum sp.]